MATSPSTVSRRAPSQSEQPVVMIGNFKRLEEIGKGSFATVYKAVHTKKKSLAAVKSVQLHKLTKKLKDNLFSEIEILRSLQHPHIVALFDCQETTSHIHLVMEYCQLGDLSYFIKKREKLGAHPATAEMISKYPSPPAAGLNEVVVRHFLKQIASALAFLRERNYIHRDIKPQNLLLNPSPLYFAKQRPEAIPLAASENSLIPQVGIESLPMLKIADFGFARSLPQTSLAETLCGSPLYMAPEILRYEKYDAKADLWSVGTVLYELMAGKPPFRAMNHVELLRRIERQDDKIKFPEDLVISDGMKKLIRSLLKKHPIERISFENFFDHPVINEEIPGLVGEDKPRELPTLLRESEGKISKRMSRVAATSEEQLSASPRMKERVYEEQSPLSQSPASRPPTGSAPSRPTSRPTPTDQYSESPPRRMERRYTGSAGTAAHVTPEQKPRAVQGRRPEMTQHATAPGRQELYQERPPSAAAMVMERRNSRTSSRPENPYSREQLERERALLANREAQERAAQDVAFERDYVVVEKRAVEVNAFADELAASPQLQVAARDRPSSLAAGAIARRATTSGAPPTVSGVTATAARAIQGATGRQRPDVGHQRTSSYERRYGPSPGSATSAISKALNMANFRLFGMGFSPPLGGKGPSPPQLYGAFPTYPTAQGSMLMIGDGRPVTTTDEDTKALHQAEELATRSDVVYGFAEVKYKQLIPSTPSNDQGLGINREGSVAEGDDLTVDAIVAISEEALVLYVKALAILAKSIDLAGTWWGHKNRGEVLSEQAASTQTDAARASLAAVGSRMNNVVQWARARFNSCLEKSEYVGRRLVEAQKKLPLDHPGHPNNHPSASSNSATSIGTSAENIQLTSGVTAEKLMYDRALEMSRQAAINELVGDDLPGCEISYITAMRMLEAVLESDDEPAYRKRGDKRDKREDVPISGMDNEDRQTILKLIESMNARLATLRQKIATQNNSKRSSLSGTPTGRPPTGTSPSGLSVAGKTPPKDRALRQ